MLLNLAFANNFSPVRTHDMDFRGGFPYTMEVDYVRFYQSQNATEDDRSCSPPEWPSADYIMHNPHIFSNGNASQRTVWTPKGATSVVSVTNYTGCLGMGEVNKTRAGINTTLLWYWYTDGRCPTFGSSTSYGCAYGTNPAYGAVNRSVNQYCRKCYPTSVFSKLAFTSEGIYGDATSGQSKKTWISGYPICPPVVCQHYGLQPEECAEESLPNATSVKKVMMTLPNGSKWAARYVSNFAANPK